MTSADETFVATSTTQPELFVLRLCGTPEIVIVMSSSRTNGTPRRRKPAAYSNGDTTETVKGRSSNNKDIANKPAQGLVSRIFSFLLLPRVSLFLIALAALFSLLGAIAIEHGLNIPPCPLCTLQRFPHGGIAILGLAALLPKLPRNIVVSVLKVVAIAAFANAALAFYHAGIEKRMWTDRLCDALGISLELNDAPKCENVPFSMLGITLAGLNGVASLGMAGLAVLSASKSQ